MKEDFNYYAKTEINSKSSMECRSNSGLEIFEMIFEDFNHQLEKYFNINNTMKGFEYKISEYNDNSILSKNIFEEIIARLDKRYIKKEDKNGM